MKIDCGDVANKVPCRCDAVNACNCVEGLDGDTETDAQILAALGVAAEKR